MIDKQMTHLNWFFLVNLNIQRIQSFQWIIQKQIINALFLVVLIIKSVKYIVSYL